MLPWYAVGLGLIPGRVMAKFEKCCMLFPCLAFSNLGKRMRVKHTVLPDGQPQTVAFTVLVVQRCGPKADESEMGAALFNKNGYGRTFDFE